MCDVVYILWELKYIDAVYVFRNEVGFEKYAGVVYVFGNEVVLENMRMLYVFLE
jgi:hypothetical protein